MCCGSRLLCSRLLYSAVPAEEAKPLCITCSAPGRAGHGSHGCDLDGAMVGGGCHMLPCRCILWYVVPQRNANQQQFTPITVRRWRGHASTNPGSLVSTTARPAVSTNWALCRCAYSLCLRFLPSQKVLSMLVHTLLMAAWHTAVAEACHYPPAGCLRERSEARCSSLGRLSLCGTGL